MSRVGRIVSSEVRGYLLTVKENKQKIQSEHCSDAMSLVNNMGGDNLSGKKKYTNGVIAKYFYPGQQPDGWVLGSTDEKKRKNSEAQKKVWESKEYRDKVDNYYHGDEFKEKRSRIAKSSWKNKEEKCKNISIAQKNRWTQEERAKQSERMVEMWKQQDYRESQTESLKEGHKNLYNENPEYKETLSKSALKAWQFNKEQILSKQFESKSKNNSWNTSKLEESYYQELLQKYDEDDIVRQYRDERYPFYCDFYIRSEDLFIELNGTWCHGGHPFDDHNELDLQKLCEWKQKSETSDYYKNAIKVWTQVDPLKVETAKKHNLNIKIIYQE